MAKKQTASQEPVKSRRKKAASPEPPPVRPSRRRGRLILAAVGAAAALLLIEGVLFGRPWPFGWKGKTPAQTITNPDAPLASFYAPSVLYWKPYLRRWASEYQVNPNVIAIVMQIESCGNPVAVSGAGAVGLMQVMPYHFHNGENMLDPDTNVRLGMSVFYECLTQWANWDLGLALACYNGGPSVTTLDYRFWAAETQFYYTWATGMWDDVVHKRSDSDTLSEWMQSGGEQLCASASSYLTPPALAASSQ
jgi:soluble lytic murein transglycosylase-like protein